MKRNCLHCKETFKQNREHQKYCSKECRQTHEKEKSREKAGFVPIERKCFNCSKPFITKTRRQIYCSDKCSIKINNGKLIKSGLDNICAGTVGAIAELIVSIDLMKQGFEVYKLFVACFKL